MESRKHRRTIGMEKEPKIKKEQDSKVNFKSSKFIISIITLVLIISAIVVLWLAYTQGVKLNNNLKLIPDNYIKYITGGVIGVTAVWTIFAALTCWHKIKNWIKIVFAVLSIILVVGGVYVQIVLNASTDLLDSMSAETVTKKAYALVVLKEGEYKKVEDLSYKLLMYYDNEMGQTEAAMEKLKDAIVMMAEKTDDIHELANKLMDETVDAILIEEAYYDIIEEEIPDFREKITTLYEFDLEDKMPEIVKDVAVTETPFNVYISGIDSRAATMPSKSRSDVNMVVSVNPKTKQVLLVNIPRDYYVKLNGTSGYRDKLTHAGIYGVDKSIKTIEDLLDIDINYYVKVNFNSVVKIIDAIGGVEVESEYAFTTKIGKYKITKGLNKLDGKKALAFSRERYALPGGDITRGKNQQAVIDAIIQKVTSTTILTKFDDILSSLKGSFQTNMGTDKMVELVRMQITDNAKWNVSSIALSGASSTERTYSMGKTLLYVMIPYAGNIKQANALIEKVLDGEMLEKGSISLAKYNDKLVVPRGVYEDTKKEEDKKEETTVPSTPEPEPTPTPEPEPTPTPEPEPTPTPEPEPTPTPEPEPTPTPEPEPTPTPEPEPTPTPEPEPTPTPEPETTINGDEQETSNE